MFYYYVTYVQPILQKNFMYNFLSLGKSGRIWTLDIKIRSLVFYRCATEAQPILLTILCAIFSLSRQ